MHRAMALTDDDFSSVRDTARMLSARRGDGGVHCRVVLQWFWASGRDDDRTDGEQSQRVEANE